MSNPDEEPLDNIGRLLEVNLLTSERAQQLSASERETINAMSPDEIYTFFRLVERLGTGRTKLTFPPKFI